MILWADFKVPEEKINKKNIWNLRQLTIQIPTKMLTFQFYKYTNPIKSFTYTLYILQFIRTFVTLKTDKNFKKSWTLSHSHVRKPAWCWPEIPPPKCHLPIWCYCPPYYLFVSTISLRVLPWHHVTMLATWCRTRLVRTRTPRSQSRRRRRRRRWSHVTSSTTPILLLHISGGSRSF